MKWSHYQNELVRSKLLFSTKNESHLDLTNSFWSWPFHFVLEHFILVMTKSLGSSPNQFGQTKTILDRPKLIRSHRRTRHKIGQIRNIFIFLMWSKILKMYFFSGYFKWQRLWRTRSRFRINTHRKSHHVSRNNRNWKEISTTNELKSRSSHRYALISVGLSKYGVSNLLGQWVPRGVGGERWPCNPRVSGSIPGAANLKKLFIWMKIHGLTQNS